jgi:putative ABC transport system permease protein
MLRQIGAVIEIIVGNMRARAGASIVAIIGVAGVVGVLVTVLAMGQSFQQMLSATGRADRAIVLSKGTAFEGSSSLPRTTVLAVIQSPGVKKMPNGAPAASMEILAQLRVPFRAGGLGTVSLRGVGPAAAKLRPEIHLVQGRMFRPGLHELIVGRSLPTQFRGLEVGRRLTIQDGTWTIVGHFEADGNGTRNSEILGDVDALQSAYHRSSFQSVTVQLENAAAFGEFAAALDRDASLAVEAQREDRYYLAQSRTITRIFTVVGLLVGGVMAVGAFFAALNTMYAAVAAQAALIATLRAIGFNAVAVVIAVLAESLALALLGATLGVALAVLLFGGHALHIAPGAQTQLLYALHIGPGLAMRGALWAIVIGLLGGLFPAVRAARLEIAEALRTL